MHLYHLDSNCLTIRQGLNAKREIDLAQIKASILEDVFSSKQQSDTIKIVPNKLERPLPDLKKELRSLYPELKSFSLTQSIINRIDTLRNDTVTLFTAAISRNFKASEKSKMADWLKTRIEADSLKIIFEPVEIIPIRRPQRSRR